MYILLEIKPPNMKLAGKICLCAVGVLANKAQAQNISFNFNTPGDLANNFNIYQNATPGLGSPYSQVTSGGVGNSGAVSVALGGTSVTADSTGIYKNSSFDFGTTGSTLNISSEFSVIPITVGGNRLLQLGFVNENTSGLNGNAGLAFVSLRLSTVGTSGNTYTPQFQDKTAAGSTVSTGLTPNVTLTSGEWYKLSATFQNQGSGKFQASGVLQDFGTDGQTPGSIVFTFAPQSFSNADMTSDGTTWPAFRGFAGDGLGKLDNFTATSVPEPGTFALLGLGIGGMLLSIRRKR